MADGIEVEQMAESRPKKVNIFNLTTVLSRDREFLSRCIFRCVGCNARDRSRCTFLTL